jgi:hypothetical protein
MDFWQDKFDQQVKELARHKYFHIPLFDGRPDRDTVINQDDIINLKILLNSQITFKEFIERS